MKILALILVFTFLGLMNNKGYGQSEYSEKLFTLSIGLKTRITPIYLKKIPDLISTPNRNVQEQPDTHLSSFDYNNSGSFNPETNPFARTFQR